MTIFTNDQIDISEIPSIKELSFIPLSRSYMKVMIITTIVWFLFILAGMTGFYFIKMGDISQMVLFIVLIGWVFLFIFSLTVAILGFRRKAYALRERDIVYRSGLFFFTTTIIPFNRVQHCEVSQGPIDRLFGLSELKIFTAGGSSSDLSIPGILPETANSLKDFVIMKTAVDEEE